MIDCPRIFADLEENNSFITNTLGYSKLKATAFPFIFFFTNKIFCDGASQLLIK